MSWRGTVLLLILAGVALGYLFFSDRTRTHPPEEPLLAIDPNSASEIGIQEGNSLISLTRTNGVWMIGNAQSGQSDRANPSLVNSLLETAAEIVPLDILRSQDLKDKVTLTSLGLKNPNRSIAIRAGKKETLSIGSEGAAPESLYVRLDSGKTVYLISGKIASLAFRPVQEYRDPRLTSLSPDHLDEISLTTPSKGDVPQQLILKRDQKGNRGWLLESPVSAVGDDTAITSWLNSLLASQIIRWTPEGTDSASYGLDTPEALINLHEEGATNPLVITIGSPTPDATGYFAKISDRQGIGIIENRVSNALAVTPLSLRSKKLTQVEFDTVDRIEILVPSLLSLTRKPGSDDWLLSEGTSSNVISSEKVKKWFDQLQNLSANSFEAATPEHLMARGLTETNPPATIRLIARLSENTAQENAGETVLAEYTFGPETNNEVAVRQRVAPELLILPATSAEVLKTFSPPIPASATNAPTPAVTP